MLLSFPQLYFGRLRIKTISAEKCESRSLFLAVSQNPFKVHLFCCDAGAADSAPEHFANGSSRKSGNSLWLVVDFRAGIFQKGKWEKLTFTWIRESNYSETNRGVEIMERDNWWWFQVKKSFWWEVARFYVTCRSFQAENLNKSTFSLTIKELKCAKLDLWASLKNSWWAFPLLYRITNFNPIEPNQAGIWSSDSANWNSDSIIA